MKITFNGVAFVVSLVSLIWLTFFLLYETFWGHEMHNIIFYSLMATCLSVILATSFGGDDKQDSSES